MVARSEAIERHREIYADFYQAEKRKAEARQKEKRNLEEQRQVLQRCNAKQMLDKVVKIYDSQKLRPYKVNMEDFQLYYDFYIPKSRVLSEELAKYKFKLDCIKKIMAQFKAPNKTFLVDNEVEWSYFEYIYRKNRIQQQPLKLIVKYQLAAHNAECNNLVFINLLKNADSLEIEGILIDEDCLSVLEKIFSIAKLNNLLPLKKLTFKNVGIDDPSSLFRLKALLGDDSDTVAELSSHGNINITFNTEQKYNSIILNPERSYIDEVAILVNENLTDIIFKENINPGDIFLTKNIRKVSFRSVPIEQIENSAVNIANMLQEKRSLQTLQFDNIILNDEETTKFLDLALINKSLKTLTLSKCNLNYLNASTIEEYIKINQELTELDLSGNYFTDEVIISFLSCIDNYGSNIISFKIDIKEIKQQCFLESLIYRNKNKVVHQANYEISLVSLSTFSEKLQFDNLSADDIFHMVNAYKDLNKKLTFLYKAHYPNSSLSRKNMKNLYKLKKDFIKKCQNFILETKNFTEKIRFFLSFMEVNPAAPDLKSSALTFLHETINVDTSSLDLNEFNVFIQKINKFFRSKNEEFIKVAKIMLSVVYDLLINKLTFENILLDENKDAKLSKMIRNLLLNKKNDMNGKTLVIFNIIFNVLSNEHIPNHVLEAELKRSIFDVKKCKDTQDVTIYMQTAQYLAIQEALRIKSTLNDRTTSYIRTFPSLSARYLIILDYLQEAGTEADINVDIFPEILWGLVNLYKEPEIIREHSCEFNNIMKLLNYFKSNNEIIQSAFREMYKLEVLNIIATEEKISLHNMLKTPQLAGNTYVEFVKKVLDVQNLTELENLLNKQIAYLESSWLKMFRGKIIDDLKEVLLNFPKFQLKSSIHYKLNTEQINSHKDKLYTNGDVISATTTTTTTTSSTSTGAVLTSLPLEISEPETEITTLCREIEKLDPNALDRFIGIKDGYTCIISHEIMKDPVMLIASGDTYDRVYIERALLVKKEDPMTRQPLVGNSLLVPNRNLTKSLINDLHTVLRELQLKVTEHAESLTYGFTTTSNSLQSSAPPRELVEEVNALAAVEHVLREQQQSVAITTSAFPANANVLTVVRPQPSAPTLEALEAGDISAALQASLSTDGVADKVISFTNNTATSTISTDKTAVVSPYNSEAMNLALLGLYPVPRTPLPNENTKVTETSKATKTEVKLI